MDFESSQIVFGAELFFTSTLIGSGLAGWEGTEGAGADGVGAAFSGGVICDGEDGVAGFAGSETHPEKKRSAAMQRRTENAFK